MTRGFFLLAAAAAMLTAGPVRAERWVYGAASDTDDGQLTDGLTWDSKPGESTLAQLLLNLGRENGSTLESSLGFGLPDVAEGQAVAHAVLRLNQQGGQVSGNVTLRITAALVLDALDVPGQDRFSLPRTTASTLWTISAPWDSSGQRIAKYAESPDLSAVIEEAVAQPGWDGSARTVALFLEVDSWSGGDNVVRFDDTHGRWPQGGNAGIEPARLVVSEGHRDAFRGREILCRPEPTSMQVNVIPHAATDAFVEWGTDGVTFPNSTITVTIPGSAAHEFTLGGLVPDSPYFYRIQVRPAGGGSFEAGPVRSFLTLPLPGDEARICVTSDIHVTNQLALALDGHMAALDTTLAYMPGHLPEPYHLWLDLGDLVVIRAQRIAFDQEEVEQRYRTAREYVEKVAHSIPFVFVRGNHEEVNGWDHDGTMNNTAVWSGKMLLKYCPPPLPTAFYSGNTTADPEIGFPGNYFAFDVGSLRIRALDPFLYSSTRPHNGHGETGGSGNGWDWSLGLQQYDWLHSDLMSHRTPFSMLAIHHLTSCYAQPGYFYGRGGVEVAKFAVDGRPSFEWGGEDSTGAHVFSTMRPGFLRGPPHDMLVAGTNQVLLKGHDHFHARQSLDDMIYVTLAKPDGTEEAVGHLWGWRFSSFYPASTIFQENSGFYSIEAGSTSISYAYIQTYPASGIGTVKDLFTVQSPATGAPPGLVEADAGKTWIETVGPNPGAAAGIRWQLARAGEVRLAVRDAGGRMIRELLSGPRDAGRHETFWDGRDGRGRAVGSGVYFVQLVADGRLDAVKMVVLR